MSTRQSRTDDAAVELDVASPPEAKIPRSAVIMVIVLMLVPGAVFLAKGGLEVADRFAPRTSSEGTIEALETGETFVNKRLVTTYLVRGTSADGRPFSFEDRDVYEMADGRIPLPVRLEVSAITGRVINLRSEVGAVETVGGAGSLVMAFLAMVAGLLLVAVPFLMPWHTAARKKAREAHRPLPAPDWGALAMLVATTLITVSGIVAWDLTRLD
jgi:hypothetical protein